MSAHRELFLLNWLRFQRPVRFWKDGGLKIRCEEFICDGVTFVAVVDKDRFD